MFGNANCDCASATLPSISDESHLNTLTCANTCLAALIRSLQNNVITLIEAGAFNGLVNLRRLYLSANRITAFHTNTFVPIPLLTGLV